MTIPDEAVEAAANAISEASGMRFDGFWSHVEDLEPEDREYALKEARAALEAASPYYQNALAEVWQQAYWQGCDDERSATEANIGYGPNRVNPYADKASA
jgi:hypothetical protein